MSQNCDCELNTGMLIPFTFPQRQEDFNGLMFVGESPGRDEEKEGRGFVGRAGKMLRKSASDNEVDLLHAIIANAARCQIYKKEMSAKRIKQVLATCRPYLVEVIHRWQPKVIIALGDIAMQQLIKKSGITKHRGEFYWSDEFGCWVLPMFHPAFILRQMDQLHFLNQDMGLLRDFVASGFRRSVETRAKRYVEIQSIRPLLDKADAGVVLRVALDTETHSLDYSAKDACVISYSVSAAPNTGYQLFLWERCPSSETDVFLTLPEGTLVPVKKATNYYEKLRELFELVDHPNVRLIMQNGNFDKHQITGEFRRTGLVPPTFKAFSMDIQVGAHLINENIFRQTSLETMSQSFLHDRGRWKKEFYESGANPASMILADRKALTLYASQDADMTLQIGGKIKEALTKEPKLANYMVRLAMPVLSKALFTLEENGLYIDRQRLETVRRELQSRTSILERQTLALIPDAIKELNEGKLKLSRGGLIAQTLFHPEGFDNPVQFMTNSGDKPATHSTARQHLLESDISTECREFLTLYEEWAETNKMQTWALNQLGGFIGADGRIHSNLSIVVAVTGRVNAVRPNVMNIPKRKKISPLINSVIGVPDDSWVLIEADASQAELRIISSVSQDEEMIRVYQNNEDIHLNTAMSLSGDTWNNMTEEERKAARTYGKSGNFGIVYGISPGGFASYCHAPPYNLNISYEEAEEYIAKWYETYPRVLKWHTHAINRCRRLGYAESILGRRRHLPEINSPVNYIRSEAERMAINAPIQSASSDIVLLAIANILDDPNYRKEECLPVLFVHDSVLLQVKKDRVDKYVTMTKFHMENPPLKKLFGIDLRVPLKCDCKIGTNRGEMREI